MGGSEAPISSAQEFGLASSAQDLGSTDSGILGMSFPFAGFNHTPIWIDQIEKGLWADKQFGVYLNRALDKNANGIGGGRLTLA